MEAHRLGETDPEGPAEHLALGREVLDALPAAVLVLEPGSSRIALANRRAAEALATSAADLVGQDVAAVLAPLEWLTARRDVPKAERTVTVTLPTGRSAVLGYSLGALGEGPAARTLVLFQDISRWEALRDERDRLLQMAAVGSALPALLHEVKNPLASVTVTVEVLLEEVQGSTQAQLHAVLSELRRMRLSLEGVGAVGQHLRAARPAAVDLACREAWTIMSARARQAGLLPRCEVEDLPLLPLEPAVIRAIVYNLIANAIQACSPGAAVNLYARLVDGGATFELTVVDNGPGMTADVLARCTELFFTTRRAGSGIGLALVRRAAEEAGGTLEITSVPGYGTSAVVRVPVAGAP